MSGMIVAGLIGGALVALLLHRANEAMTRRALASIAPTQGASGLVYDEGASVGITPKYQAVTGGNGLEGQPRARADSLSEYRSYGYEVPTKTRRYRRNPLGDAAGVPMVETMTPARAQNVHSDFATPALQALFSGIVGALVCAVGAWKLQGDVLTWLIVGFVGALAIGWLASLGLARSLVWKIERFIGQDLDGDGSEGEPETHVMAENPVKAREAVAAVVDEQARRASTANMLAFWTKCVNAGTATRDHGARPGTKALADYEAARDLLIQLGLAQWRNAANHRAGWDTVADLATGARIIGEHVRTMRQTRHN